MGGNDDTVIDAIRGEFFCPLCSTVSNCAIPHFPGSDVQQLQNPLGTSFASFLTLSSSNNSFESYINDLLSPEANSESSELLAASSALVDRIFSFSFQNPKNVAPVSPDEWPALCACSAVAHSLLMAPQDASPQTFSFLLRALRLFISRDTLSTELRASLTVLLSGNESSGCILQPTPAVTPKYCSMLTVDSEAVPVVNSDSFTIMHKPLLAHDLGALMVLGAVLAPSGRLRDVISLFCWLRLLQICIEPQDELPIEATSHNLNGLNNFQETIRRAAELSFSSGRPCAVLDRWVPFLQLAHRLLLCDDSSHLASFSLNEGSMIDICDDELGFVLLEQIGLPPLSTVVSSNILTARAIELVKSLRDSFQDFDDPFAQHVTLIRLRPEAPTEVSIESFAGSILQHITAGTANEIPPRLLQYLSSMRDRQRSPRVGVEWSLVGLDPMHAFIDECEAQKVLTGDITAECVGRLQLPDLSHLCVRRRTMSLLGLIELPSSFSDLYFDALESLRAFTDVDVTEPAVCLICSRTVFAGNRLNGGTIGISPGECTLHSKSCGAGIGIFLMLRRASVLLISGQHAVYRPSLYLDEDGEVDTHMRSNKPLYLSKVRFRELNKIYVRHEVPREVARHRRSNRGEAIRPSWY